MASPSVWRDLAPSLALLGVSTIVMFVMSFSPSPGRSQYAVVAPIWYGRAQTAEMVGRAGGAIVDFGGWTNVVIAQSSSPVFIRALYHAGALLVMDPLRLRGCAGTLPTNAGGRHNV